MATSEADGVVNSRGKVCGVKDLIVADTSIITFAVDGNTSATTYPIGLTITQKLLEEENTDNCRQ